MITVQRWIETPVCRRRVEIDVRDFMLSEEALAEKYGVSADGRRQPCTWTRPTNYLALVVYRDSGRDAVAGILRKLRLDAAISGPNNPFVIELLRVNTSRVKISGLCETNDLT